MLLRCVGAAMVVLSLATIIACGGGGAAPSKANHPPTAAPPTSADVAPAPTVDPNKPVGDPGTAINFAHEMVRKHLKHPLDASFPFFGNSTEYSRADKSWEVKGTVKAKNDFGGELTSAWTAVVYNESDKLWVLRRLEIDGETVYQERQSSQETAATADPGEPSPKRKQFVAPTQQEQLDARAQALKEGGEAAEKVEADAQAKLRLAKQFIRMENTNSAKKFLQATVKEFPGTAAAKEAEELLKTLE
jgi:hypothetical protein